MNSKVFVIAADVPEDQGTLPRWQEQGLWTSLSWLKAAGTQPSANFSFLKNTVAFLFTCIEDLITYVQVYYFVLEDIPATIPGGLCRQGYLYFQCLGLCSVTHYHLTLPTAVFFRDSWLSILCVLLLTVKIMHCMLCLTFSKSFHIPLPDIH